MPSLTTVGEIPDDLLEDIFLRLGDAADLTRASSSCATFRRIISGRRFLRRYQSLHPPPILGFLDCNETPTPPGSQDDDDDDDPRIVVDRICTFYHAESSPAARQLARAADFDFAFLMPDLGSWCVADFRDGRVLLISAGGHTDDDVNDDDDDCGMAVFEVDLVVYDPLHRRRIRLPAIPLRLTERRHGVVVTDVEALLDPVTDEDKEKQEDDEKGHHLPFRVICNVYTRDSKIWAYVFSSVTGTWRALTTAAFAVGEQHHWFKTPAFCERHYACGCFFWTAHGPNLMLALETTSDAGDEDDMKFSIVHFPDEFYCELNFAVLEADKGGRRLGLLVLREGTLNFYSKSMQDGVGAGEWRRDLRTDNPLPSSYLLMSVSAGGAAEGYVLLRALLIDQLRFLNESDEKKPGAHYFTLELKTLRLEKLCVQRFKTWNHFLYASFPPPLSLPSI